MSRRTAGTFLRDLLRGRPALLLAPFLVAACGGVVEDQGEVAAEATDADHGGGDVDVPPDAHEVPAEDGTTGDVDVVVEDVGTEDATDVPPECTRADDCDDGEPCNGAEDCIAGSCVDGTAPPDGSSCATAEVEEGICRSGFCAPASCGDGVLVSGEECDDGNLVNGDGCDISCWFFCHLTADCDDA
jgi:cysteine-rich repeat protein